MVTVLISPAFIGAALMRGEVFISMWIPKGVVLIGGRSLLESRSLLEETRYLFFAAMKNHTMVLVVKKETNLIFVH